MQARARSEMWVRKHRAPEGALRQVFARDVLVTFVIGQKAPSARRCIKTVATSNVLKNVLESVRKHRAPEGALRPRGRGLSARRSWVRKHRAPEGALRHGSGGAVGVDDAWSESTERQKVH